MKETQLLKGVLDGCVLAIISDQEIYGYELVQRLKDAGFITIVGGTVYPLLKKLEKQELIKATMKKSAEGPDRKYFTITANGKEYLDSFHSQWQNLVTKVSILMEGIDETSDELKIPFVLGTSKSEYGRSFNMKNFEGELLTPSEISSVKSKVKK